ncbi:MAG TPA: Stp1/IreP family PP2C-type Ser/Thr phosphatase [Candidatus Udaeobacter sp.]|jgi:protein phosphatase|nr:Stp1/IreP family PP2C-type Ser/Thr phosphatase [Candidatus Udaeobacter sp.]
MLRVAAATDVGLRREHNEDAYVVWSPAEPADRDRYGQLLVVADGMGGSAAGEVASRTAIETVARRVRSHEDALDQALPRALEAAHQAIHDMSREQPELAGMGTTCTAVLVRGNQVWFAHVGDSRAYLVRGGRIEQLTADHSLVAQLVQQRLMTAEQARVDPRRNVLTRSIGVGDHIDVDSGALEGGLRKGDTLLLCSDGLHGLVDDQELAGIAAGDPDAACAALIELARERGGHDNITVVLARFDGLAGTEPVTARD